MQRQRAAGNLRSARRQNLGRAPRQTIRHTNGESPVAAGFKLQGIGQWLEAGRHIEIPTQPHMQRHRHHRAFGRCNANPIAVQRHFFAGQRAETRRTGPADACDLADGAAQAAGKPGESAMWIACALALAISGALIALAMEPRAWAVAILVGLAGPLVMTRLARKQIGGQTGDIAGACQQLAEMGFLIALASR